jgi:hypothetical protein
MKTYKAMVRVNGVLIEVQVQARSYFDAQRQLEGQYGRGSIALYPQEVG